MKERIVIDMQAKFREEREQLERLIEQNADKRLIFDAENKAKVL